VDGVENKFTIIRNQGSHIEFTWIIENKLAFWNFIALEYKAYYVVSYFLEEFDEYQEEC